jgi:hypothetical protein
VAAGEQVAVGGVHPPVTDPLLDADRTRSGRLVSASPRLHDGTTAPFAPLPG